MNKKKQLFKLLNDFFDHIYLITLKRSKDRHSLLRETLDGLDYETFWGVEGRELDVDKLQKEGLYHPRLYRLLKKRLGREPVEMTLPKIGCALSHIYVYQDMLEKKYQNVLILEDDLVVNVKALESLQKALVELPDNWDLLYLGHKGANSHPSLILKLQKSILTVLASGLHRFERLAMWNPEVIRCWFPRPYSDNLDLSGSHFGTHAYGLSAKGAQEILSFQKPIVQESDNAIAELCRYEWIKAFNVKETVFTQNRDLPSTIT